jgi:hypothetical protein
VDKALSLADLHDLVLPATPTFWPPSEGFWLLLLVLAVLGLSLWRHRTRRSRANAYRRAGLEALEQAESLYQLSQVLKRVALVAWPREQVAALHGDDWVHFLNRHCAGCQFADGVWERPQASADAALREQAARWIRKHQVSND